MCDGVPQGTITLIPSLGDPNVANKATMSKVQQKQVLKLSSRQRPGHHLARIVPRNSQAKSVATHSDVFAGKALRRIDSPRFASPASLKKPKQGTLSTQAVRVNLSHWDPEDRPSDHLPLLR